MTTPDDLSQYYAELLEGIYDCVDRIVVNAFFPWGGPSAACAAGGDSSTVMTRNSIDKHLREMQGHSPAACTPSAASNGFPSSGRDSGSESTSSPNRTYPRIEQAPRFCRGT